MIGKHSHNSCVTICRTVLVPRRERTRWDESLGSLFADSFRL